MLQATNLQSEQSVCEFDAETTQSTESVVTSMIGNCHNLNLANSDDSIIKDLTFSVSESLKNC